MPRAKKGNDLKVFEGDRSRKGVQKSDAPKGTSPTPPPDMRDDEREIWDRYTAELDADGRLSPVDLALLVQFCDAVRRERETAKMLDEQGYTTFSVQGGIMTNPLFQINAKLKVEVRSLADRFGLSTREREKLAPAKPKVDDEDQRLLG